MRSTTLIGVMVLMALAATAFAAQQAPQALSLTFNNDSISVGGAVPSHPIYLFGMARETRPYITRVQPYETRLLDSSGAGKVDFAFNKERSWRSVWLAVDLTSGAAVAGSPPEYSSNSITLSGKELKKDPGGEIAQIAADGSMVQFVVIRPGVGVWGELAISQGPLDEGTDDNKVSLSIYKLQPLAGTTDPAPKKLKKGDVVFVLDSFHARYGVATVGE
jgi:hypothetical protein